MTFYLNVFENFKIFGLELGSGQITLSNTEQYIRIPKANYLPGHFK